jgi:hypothetical protein
MTKSSPLLLLVATLCLLLIALGAFWVALMPQRMLGQLAERMAREDGYILEAKNPRLGFDSGLVLKLDAVSLSGNQTASASLTAKDMTLAVGVAALFGGTVMADNLRINGLLLNVDVAAKSALPPLPGRKIVLRDGIIKMRDSVRHSVVAMTDVNGSISIDDGLKLEISYVQNGMLTTLVADAENAQRLVDDGSPADISVSSKGGILAFSGRARFNGGLAMDGQLNLESQDTAQVLAWAGMPLQMLQGAGPLHLNAGVSTDGLSATLSTLTTTVGAAEMKGLANLQWGPDRLRLTGDLTMASLPLLSNAPVLAQPWSEAPLAWTDLAMVDADLKVKAEHLVLRGHDLGPADIGVLSSSGKTTIDVAMATTKMNVVLSPEKELLKIDVGVEAKSVDAQNLLGGLLGFDHISGPSDLTIKTQSKGASIAAYVSSLKGVVRFSSKTAGVSGVDLAASLATPHEGWNSSDKAESKNVGLAFEARVDEGVATLSNAEIALPGATYRAKGEIDLLRQAFDLTVAPRGKVQSVKGTWTLPLFAANAGSAPVLRPVSIPAN